MIGLDKVQAGTYLTLLSLGAFAGYITSGRLADRMGARRVTVMGGALFFLAQGAVLLLASAPRAWLVAPVFVLLGFGGAFNILLKAHARAVFPLGLTGRAVTAVNLFGIGGAFVIQWVQGLVIDAYGREPGALIPRRPT